MVKVIILDLSYYNIVSCMCLNTQTMIQSIALIRGTQDLFPKYWVFSLSLGIKHFAHHIICDLLFFIILPHRFAWHRHIHRRSNIPNSPSSSLRSPEGRISRLLAEAEMTKSNGYNVDAASTTDVSGLLSLSLSLSLTSPSLLSLSLLLPQSLSLSLPPSLPLSLPLCIVESESLTPEIFTHSSPASHFFSLTVNYVFMLSPLEML